MVDIIGFGIYFIYLIVFEVSSHLPSEEEMHGRSDHERAAVLLAQVAVRMGVVGEIPRGKIAQSYPKQAVILLERGTRQVVVRMGGCMKTHDRKSINLIRKM